MEIQDTYVAQQIAQDLHLRVEQVQATAALLKEGATLPFIARYRKEATGSLDEVAVAEVRDRLQRIEELNKRKKAILSSLEERDLLTEELSEKIAQVDNMSALEDLYLPYRPKRRTRATVAREKGLDPLAKLLLACQADESFDPFREAQSFVDPEKDVKDTAEALAGARDILAEQVNECVEARDRLRSLFKSQAVLETQATQQADLEKSKFKDYFQYTEPVTQAPSHRLLALFRGEKENELRLKALPEETAALNQLKPLFVKGTGPSAAQVAEAVEDGYKRLLAPAMEKELRRELKARADKEAIQVFAENLRELLLAPPLGSKTVLAMDPAFRTGCKLVVLDPQGKLLHYETLYPHSGGDKKEEAKKILEALCDQFSVEAVAVGNGTASRETEAFVRGCQLGGEIPVVMVNESGASVYSASETAREEFPELDLTVRGAVSIGRRLLDPLSELVKIDPKSIGVGQYQHDVEQNALKQRLDDVVESCVNAVGVDLNTASKHLLTYVSGLGPQLAQNIVSLRDERGPFSSREELLKVPRLGPKAFEQSAGFLRIRNGVHPLDASAVHPESYWVVEKMAGDLDCSVQDLLREEAKRRSLELDRYITDQVGRPTLEDILQELAKPGRDPRQRFEAFFFLAGVQEIGQLKARMKLPGIVTNVTHFGAFVDIGVHQDGLVHISQLADRFVKDPSEVVKVNQKVQVIVMDVDLERKRIALSMKKNPFSDPKSQPKRSSQPPRSDPKERGSKDTRSRKTSGWKGTSLGDAFRKRSS